MSPGQAPSAPRQDSLAPVVALLKEISGKLDLLQQTVEMLQESVEALESPLLMMLTMTAMGASEEVPGAADTWVPRWKRLLGMGRTSDA